MSTRAALETLYRAADERRDVQEPLRHLAQRTGWLTSHAYRSDRSEPGYPDLTLVRAPGWLHLGRPYVVWVEAKRETGRLTPDQAAWAHALRLVEVLTGGLVAYRVARPSTRHAVEALLVAPLEGAK